ncbi:MAG: FAD-dependent oxidoreductase [Acidobacteria bacterium]|nr:FAD-dependent oxidoreductase [Acidobacteriota bacterium]
MQTTIAIIGGGLAGLCAARHLHRAGVDVLLLEARERLGGRILSTDDAGAVSADGFDLGPSWFWPHAQPDIAALVQELGLPHFPQYSEGDVIFERMSRETAWRYRPTGHAPETMRLVGGTGALVAALAGGLPTSTRLVGTRVVALALGDAGVTLTTVTSEGVERVIHAEQVVAAVPPRLLGALAFAPALPPDTMRRWQQTATWMAPHAKFFAMYDRPFWRDAGLSGTAQSFVGPMGEIHDATTASGRAALFGFLTPGPDARALLGDAAIADACLTQLARLYGPEARRPRATLVKDWAADPWTAAASDRMASGHPQPSTAPWVTGAWQERLSLCASETSGTEPGFMAGAVHAAHRAAREVVVRVSGGRTTGGP